MPPNRRRRGRRGPPGTQHERAVPYMRTTNREAPRAPNPRQSASRPTMPREVHTGLAYVMPAIAAPAIPAPIPSRSTTNARPVPSTAQPQATGFATQGGSDASGRMMTEAEETRLVQLAVKWKASRKLSHALFYADLAASYERHEIWHGSGRKMQPLEVERKLQAIEMRWRASPAMRDSWSDLAQTVGLWMTRTRDVEDQERTRAEADRKLSLQEEKEKGEFYTRLDAQREDDLAQSEGDDEDDDEYYDDIDVTSDEDGTLAYNNTGFLRVRMPGEVYEDDDEDEDDDTDLDALIPHEDSEGNELSEGERGERLGALLGLREMERVAGLRP